MPIKIPKKLPAFGELQQENIFVMSDERAEHQDIRPLKIVILNIMPKKIVTETQLMRLLSNTPIQVDIELLSLESHVSKNTPQSHLSNFYTTFDEIKNNRYDGMIITGAPVEQLEFNEVDYWDEICTIMEWSKTHVFSAMHICWGAQAALHYHFGIDKTLLPKKMFGVFQHRVDNPSAQLVNGFDDLFFVPHSRHTTIPREEIEACESLDILASSDIAGVHIAANKNGRQYFLLGHCEYDRDTLADEYFRDRDTRDDVSIPYNYFPNDDPTKKPTFCWRGHANLLFSNWLNYCIYQSTPYDLEELEKLEWNDKNGL